MSVGAFIMVFTIIKLENREEEHALFFSGLKNKMRGIQWFLTVNHEHVREVERGRQEGDR